MKKKWSSRVKTIFFVLGVLIILWLGWGVRLAKADNSECDHPRFQEVGCAYPGEQGPPGQDGKDGEDGEDGIDGIDGIDGKDGRDGIDGINGINGVNGKDGEVPIEWINNVTKLYNESREAAAAAAAMQVYLPQEQTSRLTFGMSRLQGETGLGVGYAYMLDDDRRSALTLSVGHAGSETAIRGSFGFEFGGDRRMKIDMAEIQPAAAPPPEPEPIAPIIEPIIEQQMIIESEHNEDIEMVQMAQTDITNRIDAIENRLNRPQPKLKRVPKAEPEFTYEQKAAAWAALRGEDE